MGIRLLGLTLSGIDQSGQDAPTGAGAEPFVGVQPSLPFDIVEN